uniref:RING-CH-type domain-containing protein n=1 Tax=Panagrellus redivivus TaxID=6233 RepID=A0A7E4VY22_PANRE
MTSPDKTTPSDKLPPSNGAKSSTKSIDDMESTPGFVANDFWLESNEPTCKICFGGESDDPWMSPCRCSGSIKWVHAACLRKWLSMAPYNQREACSTCKYNYRKHWRLKALSNWTMPTLNLQFWDVVEICLDAYSTLKMFRGIWHMLQGKKSIVAQMCYFFFWRTFIFTERRILYYKSIACSMVTSFLELDVENAK